MDDLVQRAINQVRRCSCATDEGCFQCVRNPQAEAPASKRATLFLLEAISRELAVPPVVTNATNDEPSAPAATARIQTVGGRCNVAPVSVATAAGNWRPRHDIIASGHATVRHLSYCSATRPANNPDGGKAAWRGSTQRGNCVRDGREHRGWFVGSHPGSGAVVRQLARLDENPEGGIWVVVPHSRKSSSELFEAWPHFAHVTESPAAGQLGLAVAKGMVCYSRRPR